MEYLVSAEEMQQYDYNTIHTIGIPGMVLMERAALAAFSLLQEKFSSVTDKKVFILVGTGNNGGDGLALARMLSEAGYDVVWQCIGNQERASGQWQEQRAILRHYSAKEGKMNQRQEYTVLIDALFGVGLSRNIEGEYAEAVEAFNHTRGFKMALDIPSGICADTGQVLGCAIKADATVTFGFCKRGLKLYPGAEYAGEIVTADIGITPKSFLGKEPEMFCYCEDVISLMPKRQAAGNKGTFGKVLLVAGNEKMAGAAVLAARAAYRSGAGMVKVISAAENRGILQSTIPEALYGTVEDMEESLQWADVIAIGPGLGMGDGAGLSLECVLDKSRLPLVMDADALNLLAANETLQEKVIRQGAEGRPIILTPHVGELSRLMQESVVDLKKALWESGKWLAERYHAVVVAKDARTFVCQEGKPVCVNVRGNSGMATAGSGDVLAGVIAGLMGQGMENFMAACAGVYLHATAGDKAVEEHAGLTGEYACMAGDIIEKL